MQTEPTPTDSADRVQLLARTAPFSALDRGSLQRIAEAAQERRYASDVAILVEDGTPADSLWVLTGGTVALVHDGQVILELGPGELFGHPSLLTGMAPAYTVRTRGPVSALVIGREAALTAFGTPTGAAFVADTMRRRLVNQGYATGASDVGTTPVSAIMAAPVFADPATPVRDALARLSEPGCAALLIAAAGSQAGGSATAILTDGDVRAAVAAGRLALDAPVSSLVSGPATTIPVGQLAVEAAVDMLAAGATSVAVLDASERIVGTLSAADLVGLDAQSPIALRHTLLGAADEEGLIRSAGHLPQLFRLLQRAGVPPRDLGRVLSLQHDAIVTRLSEFSLSRHGPVAGEDIAWAWLDLGSAARREFTLGSDQDNAMAYADPAPGSEAAVDAYFQRLGAEINAGLVRCGFGVDHNGVLAGERLWRMSKSAWVHTFDECFRIPDESHLIRATVAFDFRSAAGGLAVTAELAERIRAARRAPDFMRLLARSASGFPVAINRRGKLETGRFEEPRGRLDIKRGGIIPLVNLVRYHAFAAGITISPTLDRIEAAASLGALDAETAAALTEAYNLIAALRFEHHAQQIDAGVELDNLIDPGALTPIAAADLAEALRTVRRAQRQIEVFSGTR